MHLVQLVSILATTAHAHPGRSLSEEIFSELFKDLRSLIVRTSSDYEA